MENISAIHRGLRRSCKHGPSLLQKEQPRRTVPAINANPAQWFHFSD
jgi:hypothetical protein